MLCMLRPFGDMYRIKRMASISVEFISLHYENNKIVYFVRYRSELGNNHCGLNPSTLHTSTCCMGSNMLVCSSLAVDSHSFLAVDSGFAMGVDPRIHIHPLVLFKIA